MRQRIVLWGVVLTALYCASPAAAQQAPLVGLQPYDGLQAGQDAYRYWESRRLDALNRQIGWNETLKQRAAYGRATTTYFSPYAPAGPLVDPWWSGGAAIPLGYGTPFFPPTGVGYFETVPQPIGRREIQTGPNRWESFPVYAENDSRIGFDPPPTLGLPAPMRDPAPPRDAPQLREF